MEDTPMTKASEATHAKARLQALEEAVAEARRLANVWQDEVDGTHSSHHSDLRRTWSEAAEKVAEAIAALARQGGSEEPQAHIPQHRRPHHL
jgi:predicted  nucleic acid-binding Zn-ribbon protein